MFEARSWAPGSPCQRLEHGLKVVPRHAVLLDELADPGGSLAELLVRRGDAHPTGGDLP